jgi:hypothetical protein
MSNARYKIKDQGKDQTINHMPMKQMSTNIMGQPE